MISTDPNPFLRVPTRREKWRTLAVFVLFAAACAGVFFWVPGADPKDFRAWLLGYGFLFFSMGSVHAWKSIKKNWSIQEDNRHFYGPSQAWVTSKWLFMACMLSWLAARHWL